MSDKKDEDEARVHKRTGGNSLRNDQKTQLEKLMANPDKPVHIPERPEGSSAGAGSEVFHVYRHLRRRENIRQHHIQESAKKEDLEMEFQERLARNHIEAEMRTSKKRAKRLKKKQKLLAKKKGDKGEGEESEGCTAKSSSQQDQKTDDAESSDGEEAHFVIGDARPLVKGHD